MKTMTRRSFIVISMVALIQLTFAARFFASILRSRSPARAGENWDWIGEAYLKLTPEENSPKILLDHLLSSSRFSDFLLFRRSPLRDAIRADFTKGHTVNIKGWILSRTEARLCALRLLS